jgi:diguanylate cyclase (GGDEF)-like protein
LPNRALFSHHLEQALTTARREGTQLALVYLDLDRFKPINDTLGHAVGDQLLQAVALRMQASLRESDIVARIGGDEFVILLRGVADGRDALLAADKVRQALQQSFQIDGSELTISSSLGVALSPDHGDDEITLSRNADDAMYAAKRAGRNSVRLYGQT